MILLAQIRDYCTGVAAPFSSAELLRLLSRDQLAQVAAKIKQFHIESEPTATEAECFESHR